MRMKPIFSLFLLLVAFPVTALGYGPNVITSSGIVTWQLPVIIDVEGDQIKNCDGGATVDLSNHIANAASIWTGAPETGLTTQVRTITSGGNPLSVDETNYCDVMFDQGSCQFGGNQSGPADGGFNPIVYDEDGAITDLFFGVNAKQSTLGFAGIVLRETGSLNAAKGEGVINLFCMDPCAGSSCTATFSANDVLAFVVHELGHFFGMNHTQVNFDQTNESFTSTMFAVFDPDSVADITTLERDDEVGIADLYPNGGNDLDDNFCAVTGTVLDENGDEFQCANIIVRNTNTTGSKNLADAISFVSGGDREGGTAASGRGAFTVRGLAPGETYQVTVQQIDTTFPLNASSSGIVPCNGGNGNPTPPEFTSQTLSETVTCQAAGSSLVAVGNSQQLTVSEGDTITLSDITLTDTNKNVASGSGSGGIGGGGSAGSSSGCSLIR